MTTPKAQPLAVKVLPDFAPDNWESVENAFADAATCELSQAWLEMPEAAFLPATARLGGRGDALWIYAILRDADIFNAATEPNQATWTTGDVFEIFLRPVGQNAYFELHVTPENQTLQLRFPDAQAQSSGRPWSEFIVVPKLFSSRTLVEDGQWRVLVEIPIRNISENLDAGREWAFSLSRYDATRGEEKPVISSSSPHRVPRFHRQEEWRRLSMENI
ncbi:MAG: hypothetical protein KY445_01225 [Armatimonadetes bacterium]|nr:hypothetical protein [Armatimonadota bacterium]